MSRGFIDDRNPGRILNVLVAEEASAQQRHGQQVKVFGRNDGTIDHRSLIVHRLDAFADQWPRARMAVAQRKSGYVTDSRFLGRGLIDIFTGIVRPRQPGLNGHGAVRIEAGLHLEQVPKVAQQKAGS